MWTGVIVASHFSSSFYLNFILKVFIQTPFLSFLRVKEKKCNKKQERDLVKI